MITVKLYRNSQGGIYAFDADNHGKSYVCAAVSALILNTVNSISALTAEKYTCDYDKKGGHISFSLADRESDSHDARLLLNAMELGLDDIQRQYSKQLQIL
ncbi:MAG: ribosomal-processing cysteine protease Prp [Clostridiales bacterium]|jgi:uncharacterized protein YsxB (DUF464 family)|nr:ribosomal-processing cysteine protease Prp [Clostridiales bacterium]